MPALEFHFTWMNEGLPELTLPNRFNSNRPVSYSILVHTYQFF